MLPHLETEQNIDETIEMILAGKHILIVDDTIYNIMMLRILIRNVKDLKIEEAYNGKDALEKF
jgi:CheY-like chemotaxis protein